MGANRQAAAQANGKTANAAQAVAAPAMPVPNANMMEMFQQFQAFMAMQAQGGMPGAAPAATAPVAPVAPQVPPMIPVLKSKKPGETGPDVIRGYVSETLTSGNVVTLYGIDRQPVGTVQYVATGPEVGYVQYTDPNGSMPVTYPSTIDGQMPTLRTMLTAVKRWATLTGLGRIG